MFMLSSEFVFTEKLYSGIVAFSEYPKFSTSLTLSFPIKSIAFCFAVSSSISSPVNPFFSPFVMWSENAPSYIKPEYWWKFSSKLLNPSIELVLTCWANAVFPLFEISPHFILPEFISSDNWFRVFSSSTL